LLARVIDLTGAEVREIVATREPLARPLDDDDMDLVVGRRPLDGGADLAGGYLRRWR
jgi:hypothetical protein